MKYFVTEIRHVANQAAHAMKLEELLDYANDELYRSQVIAIPADIQYRAPRATPKDAEILNTPGNGVNSYNWHFYESPVTGLKGPSAPLREALESRGIGVIVH